MYQITLYDDCSNPIADGTVSYYVDSLEEFEEKWVPYAEKNMKERLKRYYRSKAGEIVTDYYSDSEKLNIVQQDEHAEILEEKSFEEKELDITLSNVYWCTTDFHIADLKYVIRKIKYNGKYLLVTKYDIKGIYRKKEFPDGTGYYCDTAEFCGNAICEVNLTPNFDCETMRNKYTTADAFLEDTIKCFVWIPIAESEKEEELQIRRLPMQELEWLLRDIPGEAG